MNKQILKMTTSNYTTTIFNPTEIETMTEVAEMSETIKTSKKIEYLNYPCAFDTETTSAFSPCGEKLAWIYEWTLGLNGEIMIGRKLEDFAEVCEKLAELLQLSDFKRLIIYVHNLAFDFQFFRKYFKFSKIFALDERRPAYALTENGIEFRCSYLLSGYSLATIGKNLARYKVKKAVGDLDYTLIRHEETPLTEKEIGYCLNDVKVVMCYIQEKIEDDGDITKIPLTNTGYVRNFCRNACMYEGSHKKTTKKYHDYRNLMDALTLSADEYTQLKRGFQGGFTHANSNYARKTLENIESYDFTSSYPYVMCSEKFPMSRGKIVKLKSDEDFKKYLQNYCCLFDVEFFEIEPRNFYENYISVSRCWLCEKVVENNGRVAWAEHVCTTVTEQDFFIIQNMYKWRKIKIHNFRIYRKGYLPTNLIKAILKLYADKTTLKGVKEKEVEYMKSKGMINSAYGMTVTDICRPEILYSAAEEWQKNAIGLDKNISEYNKSKRRFLFYPWGVWVTAYARANLFSGIMEFKSDYVYSDTDSIKVKNAELHTDYIQRYNDGVMQKLQAAADFHKIEVKEFSPKTIKGKEKTLGLWDDEGQYSRFKTLGAKRYMTEKGGELSITVSGVNKSVAVPWLKEKFENPFEAFDDDLYIPPAYTGKKTHIYIDDYQSGEVTDYLGNIGKYESRSGVHLSEADYSLSMPDKYIDFILGVKEL